MERNTKMTECCANCKYLWKMEDWTDYPKGQYFRNVCGAFDYKKTIMAIYVDINDSSLFCNCYVPREDEINAAD